MLNFLIFFILMRIINFMLRIAEHETSFITSGPDYVSAVAIKERQVDHQKFENRRLGLTESGTFYKASNNYHDFS